MNLTLAHALAQLASLLVCVVLVAWYVAPWARLRDRADVLVPLLWVHVFRYVALQLFSAQQAGFPISDSGRDQIVYGDLAAAALAAVALVALRHRTRFAVPLAWLLVVETGVDFVRNVRNIGMREHLIPAESGVEWLITTFYVPLVLVSTGVMVWQLYTRRGEPLTVHADAGGAIGRTTLESATRPAA